MKRRELLAMAGGAAIIGLTGLKPEISHAAVNLIDIDNFDDLQKILGITSMTESDEIEINAPDIAENGAVVPIGGSAELTDGVEKIIFAVKDNPSPISAVFNVNENIIPSFRTRVKMGKSSDVYVIAVKSDKSAIFAKKEIKVTLGGCGG